MFGAIIGDIVGSPYELSIIGNKTKDFPFVSEDCSFTDDTVMTVAVARALLTSIEKKTPFKRNLILSMQSLGKAYPHPRGGYGSRFSEWLRSKNPEPYRSFGNGSAMRVSPCGLIAVCMEEALALAEASASVTHNHPEGIRGAQATAAAVFLASHGASKEEIRAFTQRFYPLTKTLDEIRPGYSFDESCQGTVPQAITAFLESTDYEDAIRNAVSLGGDADTLSAITGSVAWSYYRLGAGRKDLSQKEDDSDEKTVTLWPVWCENLLTDNRIRELLPADFLETVEAFELKRAVRQEAYRQTGRWEEIPL